MATILIVDDDSRTATLLTDLLEDSGHRVVILLRGDQALATARAQGPSLILMDIWLKGQDTDGLAVARSLKADPQTRHIPILAISGHEDGTAAAREAGCDAFHPKGANITRLLNLIDEMLGRGGPP